jgi:triacylglycerol lipase
VHPTGRIADRAEQLKRQIDQWGSGRRVIILAHSMGGLDSRYMISRLGMAERVAALVSIATPHRGSPKADFWTKLPPMQRLTAPLLNQWGIDVRGVEDLTTWKCAQFNETIPDSPSVRYFSISTACPGYRMPVHLQGGYWLIWKAEGPNDGLVSVKSAKWGEHLETWPVHHMHAVNHRFPIDVLSPEGNIAARYLKALEHVVDECKE